MRNSIFLETEIHFTVETCVAGGNAVTPEIRLKTLVPATYQLIDNNPDDTTVRIGQVDIKANQLGTQR
jgi:hypothetical protein